MRCRRANRVVAPAQGATGAAVIPLRRLVDYLRPGGDDDGPKSFTDIRDAVTVVFDADEVPPSSDTAFSNRNRCSNII